MYSRPKLRVRSSLMVSLLAVAGLSSGLVGACNNAGGVIDNRDPNGVGGAGGEGGSGGDSGSTSSSSSASSSSSSGVIDPGCKSDAECANEPVKKVCDVATGDCVGCLPSNDMCAQGQYCSPATSTCEVGCTDDSDCDPANNLFCDTPTHTCVGCVADANCPFGSICISNTCVAGCNGVQPCQAGFTCCNSTCYDIDNDIDHCGDCNTICDKPANADGVCQNGMCGMGNCKGVWANCDGDASNGCEQNSLQDGPCVCAPGAVQSCYTGAPGTKNVGPCKAGTQTCKADGLGWTDCAGQVLPVSEICADNIDQDCDGILDNASDLDGDGWTVCNGDCCDSASPSCPTPKLINPGAYEFLNDGIDNDCNAATSDNVAPSCTSVEKFAGVVGDDVAKALDLCNFTTANAPLPQKVWGVISTQQLLSSGAAPGAQGLSDIQNLQTAILVNYGTGGVLPKKGQTMAGMSSGRMRDAGDPGYVAPNGGSSLTTTSTPPAAYLAAHGGNLPSSAGCSGNCPAGSGANDSVNTKLTIRVPTNVKSFSYNFRFFSAEYWTYSCTSFNDFYLAILQTGAAGIPADKNISFDSFGNPVSVNNGFFDVCAPKGCYTCPLGTGPLAGTGMEIGSTGGATAWLTTDSPIVPGETMQLELMIFDVSDHILDSLVLIDNFTWNAANAVVGTHE